MPVIFGEHLWILRENVSTYPPLSAVYLLCRPYFEALNGRPGTSNETLSEAHGGGIEDFLPLFFFWEREGG